MIDLQKKEDFFFRTGFRSGSRFKINVASEMSMVKRFKIVPQIMRSSHFPEG
jgi:hypothetical protein